MAIRKIKYEPSMQRNIRNINIANSLIPLCKSDRMCENALFHKSLDGHVLIALNSQNLPINAWRDISGVVPIKSTVITPDKFKQRLAEIKPKKLYLNDGMLLQPLPQMAATKLCIYTNKGLVDILNDIRVDKKSAINSLPVASSSSLLFQSLPLSTKITTKPMISMPTSQILQTKAQQTQLSSLAIPNITKPSISSSMNLNSLQSLQLESETKIPTLSPQLLTTIPLSVSTMKTTTTSSSTAETTTSLLLPITNVIDAAENLGNNLKNMNNARKHKRTKCKNKITEIIDSTNKTGGEGDGIIAVDALTKIASTNTTNMTATIAAVVDVVKTTHDDDDNNNNYYGIATTTTATTAVDIIMHPAKKMNDEYRHRIDCQDIKNKKLKYRHKRQRRNAKEEQNRQQLAYQKQQNLMQESNQRPIVIQSEQSSLHTTKEINNVKKSKKENQSIKNCNTSNELGSKQRQRQINTLGVNKNKSSNILNEKNNRNTITIDADIATTAIASNTTHAMDTAISSSIKKLSTPPPTTYVVSSPTSLLSSKKTTTTNSITNRHSGRCGDTTKYVNVTKIEDKPPSYKDICLMDPGTTMSDYRKFCKQFAKLVAI